MDLSSRRFRAGDMWRIPPMEYRVVEGKKGRDDLRLDWRYSDDHGRISPWRPVELDHVALIIDVIADNENVIHPWPEAGGGKVFQFIKRTLRDGWQKANYCLHLERDKKHHSSLFEPPDGTS